MAVAVRDERGEPVRRQRGVGPLLASTGVSIAGDGAFITAAPLLAASLSDNPTAIATVSAAVYVPWLFVGLPAGVLADRWPKRLVMISADLFRAVLLGLFCILVVTKSASIVILVVTVILAGVPQCIFEPAAQSVIPAIIGSDKVMLDQVNGRFVALSLSGRAMIGPLLGAWTFTISRAVPFLADAISFVISAIFVSRLPHMPRTSVSSESVVGSIRAGFRHLHRSRELVVLAFGQAAYNFGYSAVVALFVLYSKAVLHIGPIGYAAYFAVLAVGGLLSGWFGTRFIRSAQAVQIQVVALTTQAVAWSAVALFADIWVTGAIFFIVGTINTLNTTALSTSRQRLAPRGSLGIIVVVFRLYSLGASAIGSFVGGWLADVFGLSAPMLAATVIQFASAIMVSIFGRARRVSVD